VVLRITLNGNNRLVFTGTAVFETGTQCFKVFEYFPCRTADKRIMNAVVLERSKCSHNCPSGVSRKKINVYGFGILSLYFLKESAAVGARSYKGMVRSDMSKPALIFFSLQEYTQQNPLSKF
jgi:hypothetical protein